MQTGVQCVNKKIQENKTKYTDSQSFVLKKVDFQLDSILNCYIALNGTKIT